MDSDELARNSSAPHVAHFEESAARAERAGDEGEVLLAQALLLSRSSVLVGTLTSNYLALAYELNRFEHECMGIVIDRDRESRAARARIGHTGQPQEAVIAQEPAGGREVATTGTTHGGQPPPRSQPPARSPTATLLVDLDGNGYFPCSARDAPPWGPVHGRV